MTYLCMPCGYFWQRTSENCIKAKFAEFLFRDCPKRGPRGASKADSDLMRRPKWVQKSLDGGLQGYARVLPRLFGQSLEEEFSEVRTLPWCSEAHTALEHIL